MDATQALTTYGPLGIFVALFVAGLVVGKKEHDRVIGERDHAWRQRDEITQLAHSEMIPAVRQATEAVRARERFEVEVLDVLTDVRRLLENGRS